MSSEADLVPFATATGTRWNCRDQVGKWYTILWHSGDTVVGGYEVVTGGLIHVQSVALDRRSSGQAAKALAQFLTGRTYN